jgi:hypothetical protein
MAGNLTVSQAGDWVYGVALVVYVVDRTGSPAWETASQILRLAPMCCSARSAGRSPTASNGARSW